MQEFFTRVNADFQLKRKAKVKTVVLLFPKNTGCLKKTWTFFVIGIIPLFMKESFQNFVWLKQNGFSYLWGRFYEKQYFNRK